MDLPLLRLSSWLLTVREAYRNPDLTELVYKNRNRALNIKKNKLEINEVKALPVFQKLYPLR